jgi:hypothetical protein
VALAHAQSDLCTGPTYTICVAAPQPSTYTSPQDACQQLTVALLAGGVPWPAGNLPVSVTCTLGAPDDVPPLPTFSTDTMFTLCATMPFLRMYNSITRSTWSLNSPVDKPAFTQTFRTMFTNGTVFGSFWSYFSCRLNPMPNKAVPQQWMLQYADRPAQFAPPPPSSTQRETFIILGSSTNRRLRALLEVEQTTMGLEVPSLRQLLQGMKTTELDRQPCSFPTSLELSLITLAKLFLATAMPWQPFFALEC